MVTTSGITAVKASSPTVWIASPPSSSVLGPWMPLPKRRRRRSRRTSIPSPITTVKNRRRQKCLRTLTAFARSWPLLIAIEREERSWRRRWRKSRRRERPCIRWRKKRWSKCNTWVEKWCLAFPWWREKFSNRRKKFVNLFTLVRVYCQLVDLFVRYYIIFCSMTDPTSIRIIGLVGGICSRNCSCLLRSWLLGGKSTVSQILKSKGCYCIDCDKLGHKIYISFKQHHYRLVFPLLPRTQFNRIWKGN